MTWLTGAARTHLSRWFRSNGWCGADAGVDRAVDHGPRVHGRLAEGVTPDLIWALDRGLSGWGRLHAKGRRRARRRGRRTVASSSERPNLSSRARFGARTSSTRRGERGELTQGLREVARVAEWTPRRSWRSVQGRRAAGRCYGSVCAKQKGG
jgi:hypothetical protein